MLAPDRAAYGALSALISHARRAAEKGAYRLTRDDFERYLAPSECLILWLPGASPGTAAVLREGAWLKERFSRRLWLAAELLMTGRDRTLLTRWRHVAAKTGSADARQRQRPHALPRAPAAAGYAHRHSPRATAAEDGLRALFQRRALPEAHRGTRQDIPSALVEGDARGRRAH